MFLIMSEVKLGDGFRSPYLVLVLGTPVSFGASLTLPTRFDARPTGFLARNFFSKLKYRSGGPKDADIVGMSFVSSKLIFYPNSSCPGSRDQIASGLYHVFNNLFTPQFPGASVKWG